MHPKGTSFGAPEVKFFASLDLGLYPKPPEAFLRMRGFIQLSDIKKMSRLALTSIPTGFSFISLEQPSAIFGNSIFLGRKAGVSLLFFDG